MRACCWLLIVLAAAGCKKKTQEAEPEPTSHAPATGHSVTKVKGGDGDEPATGTAGSKHAGGKPLDGVNAISVGPSRACAIATDDKLWCWDQGGAAEPMDAGMAVLAVSNASCALLEDKKVWCWPHKLELKTTGGGIGAGLVIAGPTDICASKHQQLWCWKPDDDRPRRQFDWPGIDRLVIGSNRVCTVVSGGSIECADLSADPPHGEPLRGPQDVEALAMQGSVSCAVGSKTGGVECWTNDPRQRTPVPGVTGAKDIAMAPQGDACTVSSGGSVTCWKLAAGGTTVERPAAQVPGVTATAIGVGNGFACAAGDDHKAHCWSTSDPKPEVVAKK
jgi:hypothetical protein